MPPRSSPNASTARPRAGRIVRTGTNARARFQAGEPVTPPAPATPAAPFDPVPIAEKLDIYWTNDTSGSYYMPSPDGANWLNLKRGDAAAALRNADVSAARPATGLSDVERVLLLCRESRNLSLALNALAGHHAGVHEMDARRVLVRESPRIIEPVAGDCPLIDQILGELLGADQTNYFIAWLKLAYECLRTGTHRPGQVLILAGPPDSGKSLLQSLIITPLLGGRSADPVDWLMGRSAFNTELFGAEHLAMGDPAASTKTEDRFHLGEKLKALAAEERHRFHGKGKDAFMLRPFWRASLSLNDDPDKLRILPPLTGDLVDKLMLFAVHRAMLPMPTETSEQRTAFAAAIAAEMPAFADYLTHWQIPATMTGRRFGVRSYAHPGLARELLEDTPAARLADLIDAAMFTTGDPFARTEKWEGGHDELENLLLDSKHERASKRLLDRSSITRLLSRLATDRPSRFIPYRTSKRRLWRIMPPEVESEG